MYTGHLTPDIVQASSLRRPDPHTAPILLTHTNRRPLSVSRQLASHCTTVTLQASLAHRQVMHTSHLIDFDLRPYKLNTNRIAGCRLEVGLAKKALLLRQLRITVAPVLLLPSKLGDLDRPMMALPMWGHREDCWGCKKSIARDGCHHCHRQFRERSLCLTDRQGSPGSRANLAVCSPASGAVYVVSVSPARGRRVLKSPFPIQTFGAMMSSLPIKNRPVRRPRNREGNAGSLKMRTEKATTTATVERHPLAEPNVPKRMLTTTITSMSDHSPAEACAHLLIQWLLVTTTTTITSPSGHPRHCKAWVVSSRT